MTGRSMSAPGRGFSHPGALLFALFLTFAACDRDSSDPRVLELAHDTITLENGRVVQVFMRGAGDSAGFRPQTVQASVGDALRFTADDALTHAVGFDEAALSPEARAFLERSGQLRSPPLVDRGTAWVVSLEGAPPGNYTVVDLTHQHRGRITVRPPK